MHYLMNRGGVCTCQKSNGQHVKETTQFLKHKDDVYSFALVSKADSAKVTISVEMSYR